MKDVKEIKNVEKRVFILKYPKRKIVSFTSMVFKTSN